MVSSAYFDYFLAMAGAVAALTGLLFVAISIQQERTFGPEAPLERRAVAGSAFTALIVAFFISTEALLPETNIGFACMALAGLGLLTTLRLGAQLVAYQFQRRERSRPLWLRLARALMLLVTSLVIYIFLFLIGRQLLAHPRDTLALGGVAIMLQVLCGLGLFRAWELLGASRQGFLGWLNPLLDLDEPDKPAAPAAPATTAAPAAEPAAAASATARPDGAAPQG